MRPLYIFDLDGTLALIEHRRHFVECPREQQDWKAFFAACVDDLPNLPVIETLYQLHRAGVEIWIYSGRSDEVRDETIKWLQRQGIILSRREHLMMRAAGDFTPDDHQLKLRWLNEMLPEDRQRLVAVFEDRDRMVKMWRAQGIACFQVAPGDF